jgi:hypothetical protein
MPAPAIASKTSAPTAAVARARSAARARNTPGLRAHEQTALAKTMPDYLHPTKKHHRIVARADVGWGNSIYVRGDDGGLTWDIGVPMVCLTDDEWIWFYPEDAAPREIKFLRNDTDWALGENYLVSYQETLVFTPQFSPL